MSTAQEFTAEEKWELASSIVASHLEDVEHLSIVEMTGDKFAADDRYTSLDADEQEKLETAVAEQVKGICGELAKAIDMTAQYLRNQAEQTP